MSEETSAPPVPVKYSAFPGREIEGAVVLKIYSCILLNATALAGVFLKKPRFWGCGFFLKLLK